MRILFVTASPVNMSLSVGNTFLNVLEDFEDLELFSLYSKSGLPDDRIQKAFRITEKDVLRRILHKGGQGKEITERYEVSPTEDFKSETEKKVYNSMRKMRFTPFFWIQNLIWDTGKWKTEALDAFLEEIKPDVIVTLLSDSKYLNKRVLYVLKKTDAKLFLYAWDNNYSYKMFSWSPLVWLNRFINRHSMKQVAKKADVFYVISEIQKHDYEKAFNRNCKLLTKSADFSVPPALKETYNKPLQLVFTGNIGMNRWKSLAIIAKALQILNADGVQAQLRIYTGTPLSEKMKSALQIEDTSFIMGSVPASEIPKIQREADMLVHVEAFDLRNRLYVRQSFSTKLVDYFKTARPILAVGPFEVASMAHLTQNDCALTAETAEELAEKLTAVIAAPEKLDVLAQQAYLCGKNHHDKAKINQMLREDFAELMNKSDA